MKHLVLLILISTITLQGMEPNTSNNIPHHSKQGKKENKKHKKQDTHQSASTTPSSSPVEPADWTGTPWGTQEQLKEEFVWLGELSIYLQKHFFKKYFKFIEFKDGKEFWRTQHGRLIAYCMMHKLVALPKSLHINNPDALSNNYIDIFWYARLISHAKLHTKVIFSSKIKPDHSTHLFFMNVIENSSLSYQDAKRQIKIYNTHMMANE